VDGINRQTLRFAVRVLWAAHGGLLEWFAYIARTLPKS
jgi:hypothetical protein